MKARDLIAIALALSYKAGGGGTTGTFLVGFGARLGMQFFNWPLDEPCPQITINPQVALGAASRAIDSIRDKVTTNGT
jgi:hypothetical protein